MAGDAFLELHDQIARDLSSGKVVFPTYFNVTLRVRNLLRDPDLGLDEMAAGVRLEPLLASRLLQYANASALRAAGPVADLKAAIQRIGLDAVRAIAFSLAMEQLAKSKHMAPFTDLSRRLWEHSVTTAALAQCLARRQRGLRPDEALFAGLVHDLGAFYLLYRCAEHPRLSQDTETLEHLLMDWHDGIGHALLAAMQQPDAILDAVADHESAGPMGAEAPTSLRQVVILADRFAHGLATWLPAEEVARKQALLDADIDAATQRSILASCRDALTDLRASMQAH
jgi:HD-like signal output (HDOD) protein